MKQQYALLIYVTCYTNSFMYQMMNYLANLSN